MTYDPYDAPQPPHGHQQHGGYPPIQQPGGYPPHQQPGGYPPQPPPQPPARRDDGAEIAIRVVRVVTSITTTVFLLHIAFVVFDANQGNGFVSFIYGLAKTLVLGLGDVFTPDDATVGVVLNYGFAAIVYLVIGQLVIKALRRH